MNVPIITSVIQINKLDKQKSQYRPYPTRSKCIHISYTRNVHTKAYVQYK